MLSEEQEKEILNKVKIVVYYFLDKNLSIGEISETTGISTSSVQRYLNDKDKIKASFPKDYFEKIHKIKSKLEYYMLLAKKKGGTNYAKNNVPIKDSAGHFKGSTSK